MRVVSIGRMLCGSSTTQICERSRCGSRQYGHSSASLMLLHSAQMPRLSLTSSSAGRQPRGVVARRAQHVKREPLRRFLPDAGQAPELVDQALQRRGEIGHTA